MYDEPASIAPSRPRTPARTGCIFGDMKDRYPARRLHRPGRARRRPKLAGIDEGAGSITVARADLAWVATESASESEYRTIAPDAHLAGLLLDEKKYDEAC